MFCKFKVIFTLFAFIFFSQPIYAAIYECSYKNQNGMQIVSSFNTLNIHKENYPELLYTLRSGNCRELYVKKYFIDATSCNIQFYKDNLKIANVTCARNNQAALKKLKAIARKEYGYIGN